MAHVVYIALCLMVGAFAIGQRGGFFLYFILSLAMSPLAGLLILIIATSRLDQERRSVLTDRPPSAPPLSQQTSRP
ncbi:hypothetical protein [Azospirillum agricola]|uniref:hypothetical protein n=1 Tax=Azospirillum agricola TaxID=1720247 RepID=UPI000A0F2292|nr:hypothetical protein [Azospirillum agricola]SMH47716.1 hypothetical protein SAMN02982994_2648 [Azospirillum lipoferum]